MGGTAFAKIGVVLLHLIFLASVFDIYFRSPVISGRGLRHLPNYGGQEAPAKRVVVFVADGLRADSLFSRPPSNWPFLNRVLNHLGVWGVSHTRVPTESRPGHIALLAGMYEDPSAITRGWKENPVHFDTVFNASRYILVSRRAFLQNSETAALVLKLIFFKFKAKEFF